MDKQVVFFSSYELLLSIVFGLLTIYIATRFINAFLLKTDTPDEFKRNVSTGIFSGGLIICVLILVQSSVLPSVDALRTMVLGQEDLSVEVVLTSFGYFLVFYTLSIFMSILLIYTAVRIHMAATLDVDEIKEIRGNNVAQAVLLTGIIVGMTIFIEEPVGRFISSLVDYDALERLEIDEAQLPPDNPEELVVPARKRSPE